jgi:uncharacterized membrane protein YkvA (DUF1232 family)
VSTQADRGAGAGDVPPRRSGGRGAGGGSRGAGRSRARRDAPPRDAATQDVLDPPLRPRTGAKRTVTETIQQLPQYLRLLWGLMWDRRVPQSAKILVAAALAYVVMPIDWIPDFIPFFGEIDDVFLLVMSLQRLVEGAGRRVLLDHWTGDPEALDDMSMVKVVAAAAFFLPRRIRRRLRAIGRLY